MPQPSTIGILKFLKSRQLSKLTPSQLHTLNDPIFDQEFQRVILSLPNNKAPSPDGISAEYYKLFSSILIPYLKQSFNAAVSSGNFLDKVLSANIIPLPKPDQKIYLQLQFSFQWVSSFISYAGISLTSPATNLYSQNYIPFLAL